MDREARIRGLYGMDKEAGLGKQMLLAPLLAADSLQAQVAVPMFNGSRHPTLEAFTSAFSPALRAAIGAGIGSGIGALASELGYGTPRTNTENGAMIGGGASLLFDAVSYLAGMMAKTRSDEEQRRYEKSGEGYGAKAWLLPGSYESGRKHRKHMSDVLTAVGKE